MGWGNGTGYSYLNKGAGGINPGRTGHIDGQGGHWERFTPSNTLSSKERQLLQQLLQSEAPNARQLDEVAIGSRWVADAQSNGSWDIANGVVGNYLSALDSYADANAGNIYNYGTKTVSATALAEANAARMLGISRVAQGIGGVLAIGTGGYGLYKETLSARTTGTYNGQAVFDNSISLAGGIAGTLLLAAEISTAVILAPALVPVLTVVAIGATAYGVYTLGRDIYNANH